MSVLVRAGRIAQPAIVGLAVSMQSLVPFAAAAMILVVFFTILFLWNRTLRIRVQQRTSELEKKTAEIRQLNEQLRISNEELQTSNEEYESANEELQLLNEDLNKRNVRLAEAMEETRALKDFNEKVVAAVPSVLLVVDQHLRVLTANESYYASFPGLLAKPEGAPLTEALPLSFLRETDLIRKAESVARGQSSLRLPDVCWVDDQGNERFFNVTLSPVAAATAGEKQTNNVLLLMDDVTDRKRLEQEIEARERYLRKLVDNPLVIVLTTDESGAITFFNRGAERLLGHSAEEMRGTPAAGIFSDEADFRVIREHLESQETVENYESVLSAQDEERVEVTVFATTLHDEQERGIGYLFIATDIREKKRAEQNLLLTNRELMTLYSISQTVTSSAPLEERLQAVVEKVRGAFECRVSALALCDAEDARRVEKVYVAGDEPLPEEAALSNALEAVMQRLVSQKSSFLSSRLSEDADVAAAFDELREGESFVSVPLSVGAETVGCLMIVKVLPPAVGDRDVDLLSSIGQRIALAVENDRLYGREKENVSRLRAVVNATRVIGSILSSEELLEAITAEVGNVVSCTYAAILSYSAEERRLSVVSCSGKEKSLAPTTGMSFPPEGNYLQDVLKSSQVCRCSKSEKTTCPLRQALRDSGVSSCLCAPLHFDDSVGVLSLGQSNGRRITDIELQILFDFVAHASLSIKNAHLYTKLQEAYANLQRAQDSMVKAEKYRAIGELSAGVAHDFNNALSIILGRAQHLITVTKNQLLLKGLKSIENASRDAAGIVQRMQQFSKSVPRKPFSRIALNDIARQVLETIEPRRKELAELRGVRIDVVSKLPKVKPISGDAGDLREALTNVVFNAMEAMPRGGRLTVTTGVRGDSVFIEVEDTGVGMSPEVREKALQPFFTTKPEGTGLGLSLVHGAVKRHNGHIEIRSEPGEGTTVTLSFPIDFSTGEVRELVEPYLTRKGKILIVDDNPEVTRALRETLEEASHEVIAVTTGEEGIRMCRETSFDIVITDVGMPGISGLEASRAIRALRPTTRTILMTAWDVRLSPQQMEESAASLAIQKPFEKGRLLSAIEELLSPP
jgi:PAS domain S-box-containing protein